MLWNPDGSFEDAGLAPRSMHMVPQSAWYAVGLLARGDRDRAERVLSELCPLQYDQPGTAWHGTFARFAEWPQPTDGAAEWIDYDPNWRQFVGTTFALIRRVFDLPPDLDRRMQDAIELAISGEPAGRVSPRYSNIALMKAWLEADEDFAGEVVGAFDTHGAFDEYGSPTYYGIDLYALALWRKHPPSARFAEWGERVWRALWQDIARWWHPGLANLCGPYSRAYGMDMSRYVALLGLWLPTAVLPAIDQPFTHSHDLTMAPVVALLDGGPAGREMVFDAGPRLVEQQLDGGRVASGWLAPGLMLGGERGARWRADGQYHPATAHWLGDNGRVAWLRLRHSAPLDVIAGPGTLTVAVHDHHRRGRQPVVVETSDPATFAAGRWKIAGRPVFYSGPPADSDGVIDAGTGDILTLTFTS